MLGAAGAPAAIGVVVIAMPIVLYWVDLSHTFGGTQIARRVTASGIPVQVLWAEATRSTSSSLAVVLIPVAVVCLVSLILPHAR